MCHNHHHHHGRHPPRVRGLVLPWLLLALARGPAHGYQLLDELVGAGLPVDPGILYRTLRALEEEGAVVSAWDTGGGGPARRVYRLTDHGRELLAAWARYLEGLRERLGKFLRAYRELEGGAG
ncbi:MAG: PadR family transcriptional regulator [Caldiserica bacterium]|nr:PadR family transcriptional regulator [Caldisericota bacterium]